MLDDPGTVMASTLVGDSSVEDGHYKVKCEELQALVENQQKIISDYQVELQRKEQVCIFLNNNIGFISIKENRLHQA